MNDPRLRDILDPLTELRTVTPPRELGVQMIRLVRQTLAARRRRIVRFALVGCASAAALVVVGLSLVDRSSAPPSPALAPLAQLKQAIQSSNDFRGVVQISLEEVQLDSEGHLQAPPRLELVQFNTVDGNFMNPDEQASERLRRVLMRRVQLQLQQQQLQAQADQARGRPVGGTILIPLTWEGGTIPIPTNPIATPPSLQPYAVGPDQAITLLRNGDSQQYQIRPVAPQALTKEQATVWVNPKTGLVDQVRLERTRDAWQQIQNYKYRYVAPDAMPAAPDSPRAIPTAR